MTPEEFAAKLEELRAVFADKLVELRRTRSGPARTRARNW